MTATYLFYLTLTMLVNITDYVLTVGELASSFGMYLLCLLPPDTFSLLILISCFCLRNLCDFQTIWSSSYVRSRLCTGIKVFLRCRCFISLLSAECDLSIHYFKPALRDNCVMIAITTLGLAW